MIISILQSLADTSSTNDKKAILAEAMTTEHADTLKRLFIYAYNPFITFGVSKVDVSDIVYENYSEMSESVWWDGLFALLSILSSRQLTGNAAKDSIKSHMARASEKDAQVVLHTLKKDLRIGAGVRLINAACGNILPEDFCMSANKYDKKRVTFPVYADTKLDGVRCIASFGQDSVTLFSRNGKEFKNYTTIESELMQLSGFFDGDKLDGEVTLGHFQDLMKTVSAKTDGIELAKDAVYNIFDIPSDKTFNERLKLMNLLDDEIQKLGLTHVKIVDGGIIEDEEALNDFYEAQLAAGQEGCMIKTLDGKYEFKRGWGWQKMKPEHTEDLEIIRCEEGNGKYEGQLGVFVCRLENGGEVRVGSGLKDDEREALWNRRDELIGQFIEIKFQEKTKDGSLRFPIFIKFRPDKS